MSGSVRNFRALVGRRFGSDEVSYTVLDILGSGAYGAVALCSKTPPQDFVAVKFIKDNHRIDDAMEEVRILQELQALGSENVPIVKFSRCFMFSGYLGIEFEKLDVDLLEYYSDHPMNLQEIRPFIKQMGEALCFLKSNGFIHTDLKPDNIMVINRHQKPVRIKVIDFGLAVRHPLPTDGRCFQSLWYKSPEAVVAAPITEAIDVWALGCITAELLAREPLFQPHNALDLVQLIISTVGMLPRDLLDKGNRTRLYFDGHQDGRWLPKGLCFMVDPTIMADFLQVPDELMSPEHAESMDIDLADFKDLVNKMLSVDPQHRIKAEEILEHPFVTMTHLADRNDSYFQSSAALMEGLHTESHPPPPVIVEPCSSPVSSSSSEEEDSESLDSECSTCNPLKRCRLSWSGDEPPSENPESASPTQGQEARVSQRNCACSPSGSFVEAQSSESCFTSESAIVISSSSERSSTQSRTLEGGEGPESHNSSGSRSGPSKRPSLGRFEDKQKSPKR